MLVMVLLCCRGVFLALIKPEKRDELVEDILAKLKEFVNNHSV